tara:strand:+ start:407 stop:868 length:462 start_codon:yes stop_codon:yes gene_type:complete
MIRVKEKILLMDLIDCFKKMVDHSNWKTYEDKGVTCKSIIFYQKLFLEELLNFYNNGKDVITSEEIAMYHNVVREDIKIINKMDTSLRPVKFELPTDNTVLSWITTSRAISDSMIREAFLDAEIVTYFELLSELLTNMSCYCYKNEKQEKHIT